MIKYISVAAALVFSMPSFGADKVIIPDGASRVISYFLQESGANVEIENGASSVTIKNVKLSSSIIGGKPSVSFENTNGEKVSSENGNLNIVGHLLSDSKLGSTDDEGTENFAASEINCVHYQSANGKLGYRCEIAQ